MYFRNFVNNIQILVTSIVLLSMVLFFSQWGYAENTAETDSEENKESKKPFDKLFNKTDKPSPSLNVVITIDGLEGGQKKNALVYLEIEKNKESPKLTEKKLKIFHSRAEEDIQSALQPFGFYQVIVESSLTQDTSGVWQARYQVQKGERVKITQVDIQINGDGAKETAIIAIKEKFPIKVDDLLDHGIYDAAKSDLVVQIGKLGYSSVKFEKKQLRINPKKNTAEIVLYVNTGEQFFLGEFRIHQDFLKPSLVDKYIVGVKSGDPYSQKSLLEIQQLLITSGYFSVVDVKPEFNEVDQQKVPIDITLTKAKQHRFSFGGGFDTDIGVNLSAGWKNRLLNSYGHHSDVLLKLSSVKNSIKGTYWVPVGNPKEERLGFSTKFESETLDDVEWDVFDIEGAYYFKWHEKENHLRKWEGKLFAEYKIERATISHDSAVTNQLMSLGGEIQGSFFEEGAYPRKGWSAYARLQGSPSLVLSDTAYFRAHLKSNIIFPVFDKGRLLLRGELGVAGVETIAHYPGTLRFFAGGDKSVRGYDWKSLGPTNREDDVVGGKNVVTGSIEYNHRILSQWVAATFIDAGNAFDDKLDKLYYGGGVGARWISPVGLVRFDLGFPLNDDDQSDASSVSFYFGFEVNL